MTALKPLESRRVVGVKDGQMRMLRKLVTNRICSMPECEELTNDVHHIWPRSLISSDSYFVEITDDEGQKIILPNFTGLCRKHHSQVEIHEAWIKYGSLEANTPNESLYGWYRRGLGETWSYLGPLNPQPGSITASAKKRKRKQGEERRARRTVSIAVPQDEQEDGAGILDDLVSLARERWSEEAGWKEKVPTYFVLVRALVKALQ